MSANNSAVRETLQVGVFDMPTVCHAWAAPSKVAEDTNRLCRRLRRCRREADTPRVRKGWFADIRLDAPVSSRARPPWVGSRLYPLVVPRFLSTNRNPLRRKALSVHAGRNGPHGLSLPITWHAASSVPPPQVPVLRHWPSASLFGQTSRSPMAVSREGRSAVQHRSFALRRRHPLEQYRALLSRPPAAHCNSPQRRLPATASWLHRGA